MIRTPQTLTAPDANLIRPMLATNKYGRPHPTQLHPEAGQFTEHEQRAWDADGQN